MNEKLKIIIVDDERGFRDLLRYELSALGYEVTVAANGEEAVEKIAAERFDFAVTDLTMPRMSGLEVLAVIKQKNPSIQVILMSGYITEELASECARLGALGYIPKPFPVEDLAAMIEKGSKRLEEGRRE